MPQGRSNSKPVNYLGIATAVSVFFAFPIEQARHFPYIPSLWRGDLSCDSAVELLDLGAVVQSLLAPLFVFLLPGAGSILQSKTNPPPSVRAPGRQARSSDAVTIAIAVTLLIACPLMLGRALLTLKTFHPGPTALFNATIIFEMIVEAVAGALGLVAAFYLLREHMTGRPMQFFAAGWLFSAAISIAWWYSLKYYASQRGLCPGLFNATRPADFLRIDYLYDSYRYFLCLSVFTAFWSGIAAGGLRLQAARVAETGSTRRELDIFRNFFWLYLLAWAVQYRLSEWLVLLTPGTNRSQEWLTFSVLSFIHVTATAFWSLAFIRWFWKARLRTRAANVAVAFGISWVIPVVNLLAFFWTLYWAGLSVMPFFTLNVTGLAWAWMVGTRRWRALALQPSPAVSSSEALEQLPGTAASASQPALEPPPKLAGLKALQIVAIGVGIFMLVLLFLSAAFWYMVLHQHAPPRFR